MRMAQVVAGAMLALVMISTGVEAVAQTRVTSNFGYRKDPFHGGQKFHAGMDFGAKAGTPVYATGDGYIKRARWAGGYGNLIEIEHGFGYQTRFGHLSKILVSEGQFVRRGELVGLVGSTGRSTAPHLHYEVRINGAPTQPADHMQIVFNQQPDWRAVLATLNLPTQTYQQRPAVVAMARALPKAAAPRITADIDLDLSDTSVSSGRKSSEPGSSFGYVAGVKKP